jgi:hypothetical protein
MLSTVSSRVVSRALEDRRGQEIGGHHAPAEPLVDRRRVGGGEHQDGEHAVDHPQVGLPAFDHPADFLGNAGFLGGGGAHGFVLGVKVSRPFASTAHLANIRA